MMTIEERQEAAKWFQNRAIHTTMPGAKMMFERAAEALSEGMQPQWIPCSERLPEKEGMYIVCFDRKQLRKNEYQIETAYWLEGEWKYGMIERFEHRMPEYVIEPLKELTVTAWMPLPKPYGGESDEN